MEVSLPEHRIYTVLACFQVAFVMIGTFAVRVVTSESFNPAHASVPLPAYLLRNWGFLLLLMPLGCLIWALRDMREDPEGRRSGRRILIGILLTVLLGTLFWLVWDQSTMHERSPVTEVGNM